MANTTASSRASSHVSNHAGNPAGTAPSTARPLLTRTLARAGLAITLLALLASALLADADGGLLQALADLRFSGIGPRSLLAFALALLGASIGYLLLGAFAVAGLLGDAARPSRLARMRRRLAALAGGGMVAGIAAWCIAGIDAAPVRWHGPGLFEALLPLLAAGTGALLGDLLRCPPRRALTGLALRLFVLAIALALTLLWLRALLLAPMPLDLPTARVTSADKRALVELARNHNPFRIAPGDGTELRLTPDRLRTALAWGTSVFDPTARARVSGTGDALRLETSIALGRRFLNVDAELAGTLVNPNAGSIAYAGGDADADSQVLQVDRCRLQVGDLTLTQARCAAVVRGVHSLLAHHPALTSGFAALRELAIDGDGMVARYGALSLDSNAKGTLRQLLGPSPAVRAGVEAQVTMLRNQARGLVASEDPFAAVLRASFELARARSAASDPAAENQAAILALAGLLGHHDVFTISGLERPDDHEVIRDDYARVRLRGRDDWRKHFLVSAALTQVSNTVMSDAAGLLKEELDAGGGSGFSFSDLLMDRAGTLFGEVAVRDARSARALQALLIEAYDVDHIAPPAADLPENLDDAALQRLYGGVGGPGYRALVEEIERRVRAARAYQRD